MRDVYQLAQNNDPAFASAKYAFEAVQEKIPQARAGLLPSVSLNGGDNDTRGTTQFSSLARTDRDVRAWTWTLQLTQPLFRAQNLFAYRESVSLVEEAHAKYSLAAQELILRVTQAYADVLVSLKGIEVSNAQLKAAEEQAALARRGFETGINAITDVDEARSRVDLAQAQHISALNELEIKRAELEKAVGAVPESLSEIPAAFAISSPQPDDVKAWVSQARENNPAVLAPQAALRAAETEVSRSRSEHLPVLDMVASTGRNYSSGSLTTPNDFSMRTGLKVVGVQLTVPIFSGGGTHSRVNEAIANKNRAAAELEAARRQAAADARQAYSAVVSGLAKVKALESAVASSESAVKGNQAGYKLGIRMNIDVLNAEQQLYVAQRDLVQARYDTLIQGLKLKAAAGILTESDVLALSGHSGE